MRRLRRPNVALPTLTGTGKGAKAAAKHLAARSADSNAVLKFDDHWNEPDVRGALYAMHGQVCAYCQCELRRNDRGDVEHFRPKSAGESASHSGYWWLAYAWDNYLLSCSVCNRKRKSDDFPIEAYSSHVTFANKSTLLSEKRLLADPCDDPVHEWFELDSSDYFCPVEVSGLAQKNLHIKNRCDRTIELFQINVDIDLVRERVRAVTELTDAIQAGRLEECRKRSSRYSPYGIWSREYLGDVISNGGLSGSTTSDVLPQQEEELDWLLDELHATLTDLWRHRDLFQTDANARREQEILWSLAVLWKDPPLTTISADVIEAWLVCRSLAERVRPYLARL